MSGKFHVYDCTEVSIMVCGLPIEGGFGEDTFIEIEPMSEDFVTVVGADGDVTRSKTNDYRARVRLTLMQSSEANALLSALNIVDRKNPNGAGVGPCMIKDNQGTSLHAGEKSWVAKRPTSRYGKKGQERVWEIEVADMEDFIGGN